MKIIKKEKLDKEVKDQETWNFDVEQDGVYVISVSARCKSWLQNFKYLFSDDDLAIQVDNYLFAEIKGKKREFASHGSWNGNEIKNNTKTVLFVLPIKSGSHKITFWVGGMPFVEEIGIYSIEENEIDLISSEIIAFKKFLDITVKNLKIEEVNIMAKAGISSKLELRVDEKVQKNSKYKRFEKWYWYGKELKGSSKDYILSDGFDDNKHAIQFVAKGNPEVESLKLKINRENVVYEYGYIRLYKDIQDALFVRLRSTPSDENNETLAEIKDGERVAIHKEVVFGKYMENLSETWHEVIFNGIKGFILSSFVEIDGQEREKIIDLIKEKCNQYNGDANIILSIAGHESHFKPYAKSYTGAQGVFQLTTDTAKEVGVSDRYDMYKNVDGGVRYYKLIEKRIIGRGDILEKRLAGWHDGPTGTLKAIRAGTFNYDKLSNETKSFIKSVKANSEKRDWYHIISLSIVLAMLISSPFLKDFLLDGTQYGNKALVISYLPSDFHETVQYSEEARRTYVSSSSVVFNAEKYDTAHENEYLFYPNVFFDATTSQIMFLNSQKKIVGKIDARLLNLDKMRSTTIDSVVIENPKNVFYFFGITDCGARNCWFNLYHFDANTNKLEMIDADIFGGILELHFSPDSKKLVVISAVDTNYFMSLYDVSSFNKQKIEGFFLDGFSERWVTRFSWVNNNTMSFDVEYSTLQDSQITKVSWLYKSKENQIKETKREVMDSSDV